MLLPTSLGKKLQKGIWYVPLGVLLAVNCLLYKMFLAVQNILGCLDSSLCLMQDYLYTKNLLPMKPPNLALLSPLYFHHASLSAYFLLIEQQSKLLDIVVLFFSLGFGTFVVSQVQ